MAILKRKALIFYKLLLHLWWSQGRIKSVKKVRILEAIIAWLAIPASPQEFTCAEKGAESPPCRALSTGQGWDPGTQQCWLLPQGLSPREEVAIYSGDDWNQPFDRSTLQLGLAFNKVLRVYDDVSFL